MPTPRVAAIHDLSCFGRCSLTIALPVLSAMGCQCCPLPTALLSAHTGFTGGSFQDMTRVAYLNEQMWTQLFVDNRENLCREIAGLIERLEQFRAAISQPDPDRLRAMLRAGRIRKTQTEKEGIEP